MLKILNFTRTLLGTITDYQDLEIIHSLQDGDEQISFKYLGTTQIKNEYYVQTDRARYTIKSAEPEDDGTEYHGLLDLEDLQRNVFKQFTSTGQTLQATAQAALQNTLWTVSVDPSITGTRNVQRFKKTPLDIIYAIRDAWMCEVRFDNLNNVVYFSEQFGEDKGVYLMRGLNLRKVTPAIDTYDYVTRIIPYGADGLTIDAVNEGIPYVENYQYTTKILTLIWEDTSYNDATALKTDATKKLDDLSKPKNSYSCDVIALSKMSGTYSILDYKLGDTVHLHDPVVGVNEKQRIVKYNEHPENPEMDSVEISNVVLSFEELQSRMNAAAQAWEEVMNGDGTVNGVYVHGVQADDVVGIETVITENATVQAGVTNVSVQYAQGTSPTIPPEDGWSEQAPTWDEGKYMWQRTVTTHASGVVDPPVVTCISGARGQTGSGIDYQVTYYAVSPSDKVPPLTGQYVATEDDGLVLTENGFYVEIELVWYTTPPDRPQGWFTWMYIHTVYTDGTTEDTLPVCISGSDGSVIEDTHEQYYLSTSNKKLEGGEWYDEAPDYIIGRFYWTRTITIFSNGDAIYSTPVLNMALTTANSKASTALESANGKNANFYQVNEPSSVGRKEGDLWFVMGTGANAGRIIALKEWTGSRWTETPLTSAVFAFIDAGKITTGILSAILIKSDNDNYWNLSNSEVDGIPARSFKTKNGTFEGTIEGSSFETRTSFQALSGILDLGSSSDCKFGKSYPLAGVTEGSFYGEQHSSESGPSISGSEVELIPGYRDGTDPEYGFVTPNFIAAEELFAREIYVSRYSPGSGRTSLLNLGDYVNNGGAFIKIGTILIQWGSETNVGSAAQTTSTKSVSFSNTAAGAFTSSPYVFVSGDIPNTSDTTGRVGNVNVAVRDVSSTGFTIRVSNSNSGQGADFNVNVYWMAIGTQS